MKRPFDQSQSQAAERQNRAAENGILISMLLQNFMCHTELEVHFGPFINFVFGHNGSGKSAILTAIQLCFGGKPTTTNRGSSLKSFIKEGCQTARIVVRVKNSGDGYKRDTYGDVVIVERRFSADGSSGYKLKSQNEKTVSTKKEDLDDFSDHVNLQMENPLNILTQDKARQFLTSSSPQEKYKLFLLGVQLSQLNLDYFQLKQRIDSVSKITQNRTKELKDLETKVDNDKQRYQNAEKQNELESQLNDLKREIVWAQVHNQKKLVEDQQKDLDRVEDELKTIENSIVNWEAEFDQVGDKKHEAQQHHKSVLDKQAVAEEESRLAVNAFNAVKAQLMDSHKIERQLSSGIKDLQKLIKSKLKEIDDENKRLSLAAGGQLDEVVEKLKDARLTLETSRKTQAAIESEEQQWNLAVSEKTRDLRILENKKQSASIQLQRCSNDMQSLNDSEDKILQTLGVKQLLQLIQQNENKFLKAPIGPLGKYVTLRDPDWSSIAARILGSYMRAFIVFSHQDRELLSNLMNQARVRYNILEGTRNDFRIQEPEERFLTLLRILDISDPDVKAQLIVHQAIEQAILEKHRTVAEEIMYPNRPANVQACYALNPNVPGAGFQIGNRRGGSGFTPLQASNERPFKSSFDEQKKRALETSHRTALREHARSSDECARLELELKALQTQERSFTRRKSEARKDCQQQEDAIELLTQERESFRQNSQLNELEAALKTLRNDLEFQSQQFESLTVAKVELVSKQQECLEEKNKKSGIVERAKEEASAAEEAVSSCEEQRKSLLTTKARRQTREDGLVNEKAKIASDLASKKTNADSFFEEALKSFGPQMRPLRSVDLIRKKCEQKQKQLDQARRINGGSVDELRKIYNKSLETLGRERRELRILESINTKLGRSWEERKKRWVLFRKYISARAKAQFGLYMLQRGFRGRIVMDHTHSLLDLVVTPDRHDTQDGRGPKTLSGGEKSYSQICLLLSLWEAMGSPIRCLDEFDVFMDAVNRRISMQLMIKAALQSVGKQFLLITPQEMGNLNLDDSVVKVIRLIDPVRGSQTRLQAVTQ